MNRPSIEIPETLGFLMHPMRYKVARGGRGSSKSWSYARALLSHGAVGKQRILCTREVQNSIRDSVYKLLCDQIELMGLGSFYRVLGNRIEGSNGTEFIFHGLADQTVESIKSFESIDICWVEEAQAVSKRSWTILLPTIRNPLSFGGEGAEVWVTFNPRLETDDTYQRFVVHPPYDCISVEINWRQNPWWNPVLEKMRLHDLATLSEEEYNNIWEGVPLSAIEGAIYHNEIAAARKAGRITLVPYDPMLKVHPVFDLGWDDSLGCGLVQKHLSSIRIIEYLEANRTKLSVFSAELKRRGYNWGKVWLPHDGFAKRLESDGKSTYEILKRLGWKCAKKSEITQLSIAEGIRNVRLKFDQIYFNELYTDQLPDRPVGNTVDDFYPTPLHFRLVEALKRHRRRVNKQTGAEEGIVRDDFAHGGDVIRYICANADNMTNEEEENFFGDLDTEMYQPLDDIIGI